MNCQEILTILQVYRDHAIEFLGLKPGEIEVSSAYSFIVIEATDLEIQFEVNEKAAKIYQLYPDEQSLRAKIEGIKWPGLDSALNRNVFAEEVIKNLTVANAIASVSVNCATGDDYRPGNFSKIFLTQNEIELQQINHMNAKSLDHKKNYSLRSLIFKIDLQDLKKKMEIEFHDSSSENNKHCGDAIKKAIAEHYSS